MPTSTTSLERYRAALGVLGELPTDVAVLHGVSEAELLQLNQLHTQASRQLGAAGAAIAGELAYRSRPELGSDGLARRSGHRTVENLLRTTTGATKEHVLTVVKAGTLLVEVADDRSVDPATGAVREASEPWLRVVAEQLVAGRISVSASNAISRGLGIPNSAVTAEQLARAADELVAEAIAGVDADRLWRNARDRRDELDLAGVKIREHELRELRGLTHRPLPAGGGIATWRMDPETYALFVDGYDRMTSPKRGGVRFVDKTAADRAQRIEDDPRTPAQLASDGFLHLLRAGATVDDSVMLGAGAPIVRITVAADALQTGVGLARIDGQAGAVSLQTAQRLLCDAKVQLVGFDPNGHYIEVDAVGVGRGEAGENARLYSKRQGEALAAKFGGCMDPACDRPPSWCERHHILQWARDRGKTRVENGILLCRYHHLLYHNQGYETKRDSTGAYWKIPPTSVDPDQTPVLMPLKTRNLDDLRAAHRRARDPRARDPRCVTAS